MYGNRAKELLLEVKRGDGGIPAYNRDTVRAVCQENEALGREGRKILELLGPDDPLCTSAMTIYLTAGNRNVQCLYAYHMARVQRIEEVRWRSGTVLPPSLKDALDAREVDYFRHYSEAVTQYMTEVGIDLAADMHPPQRNLKRVRALRDCGELMTSSGPKSIFKDGEYLMAASDAETYARKGWVVDTGGADERY